MKDIVSQLNSTENSNIVWTFKEGSKFIDGGVPGVLWS